MTKREDTRDFVKQLDAYETRPQTQISDKVNPFRGSTPAQAASPAAVAAVAAGQVDATPGGAPQTAAAPEPLTDDSPVVDEDGTLGDPTDSGEGTSDAPADSSTAAVDHGDEADPNADLTGEDDQPPKKGSARERIVELNDLAEGFKEYGKLKAEEVKQLREQLARATSTTAAPAAAAPPAAEEKDEPMPDMADEDVAFDNDKYRTKMAKWVKNQTTQAANAAVRAVTGADTAARVNKDIETKCEAFAKNHPDFKEVVTDNPVMAQNQLGPDAGAIVIESEHTADMLYRFGKDPALAIRVARMSPRQQVQFVTRMEDEIAAEKKAAGGKTVNPQGGAKPAQKKSITQAPPPPKATPPSGRAQVRDIQDPTLEMNDFARRHRDGKQAARAANRQARGL